jgi:uncharacterized protein YcnI
MRWQREEQIRMRFIPKVAAASAAVAIVVWWAPGSALAHVGVDKDEVEAGSSTSLGFSFSHGCEESPTNSMSFQIPEGVYDAVPQVHAGWDIEVEREDLAEPVEGAHGQEITDRASVITFTAREGFDVPNGQKDTFVLSFTAPEQEGPLSFPVIQGCVEGTNDWIEAWDGTGAEPESPAPFVTVVAGSGGDDHEEGTETTVATGGDDTVVETTVASGGGDDGDDGDDDGGSNALAITGVVLGAAGLGLGGVAFARSGRKPPAS